MYLQQRRPNIYYHQRRISTNEQILAGNHFYGSCGDHCCGGGTLLLSYSPPGRKFRYVLFSSGILGGGGEYWQFFGVFVGHWQLVWSRSERSTRAFSQQTELVIGRLLRTWQTARTKIWADAKPWGLYSIILDIRLLQNFCRCWSSLFKKFQSESEMWLLYGGCQKPELIQERVWGATRFLRPTIWDNEWGCSHDDDGDDNHQG